MNTYTSNVLVFRRRTRPSAHRRLSNDLHQILLTDWALPFILQCYARRMGRKQWHHRHCRRPGQQTVSWRILLTSITRT